MEVEACHILLYQSHIHHTGGTNAGFDAKLGKLLKFLREIEGKGRSDAIILPCLSSPKGTMPIVSAGDFPQQIVRWKDNYTEMGPNTCNPTYKEKSKKVHGCFTVGFNMEVK